MNLKFYKTGTKPTTIGSLWFNPTTKRIELITGTSTSDVYGSDIQDATYSNDILTIEKIDGSAITIDLSDYATSSELENSLANKLNKIKVNNSTVNSTNLNIVGSGGTTVSNNSGTITISSETAPTSFDASAITSGTIDLERLPKGALERLFIVSSENDAMHADCQEGDTVQVTGNNNKMYFCVNGSATTFTNKFREYTAGAATSVPWSGVTGKPNVEDGAQKNVQSDWNATSGDAFILNKPTIPTKTSQLTNDSGYLTEHQSLDNYYTKEQTDSSINTALDAVNEAVAAVPQTYDIGWLMNLISTSEGSDVTLTAEQFNEIKAAYDAGKIFVTHSNVYSSIISIYEGTTAIGLITLSGSDIVTMLGVISRNGTYNASLINNRFITRYDLTGLAKASDIPTKTSQLTNDSGFANASDIPTKTSQLTNDSNFLTEIPIASGTKVGGIKVSTNSGYSINNTGLFELNSATSTSKGIVSIGTGLTVNSGKVTLNTATSSSLGGVIVPNNGTISVDTSGNISVSDKVALKTDLDSKQDAITYSGSLDSNVTLTANSLIDLGTRSSAITVLLPSTANSDHKEYWFRFTADSTTAPSLSLPSSVLWQDGKTPTIKPGETYEFCITDNLVTYSMFKTAN